MKRPLRSPNDLDALTFTDGLVPVIAQDEVTGNVLMMAWADRTALEQSLSTGRMTYWSRSRQSLWAKGETSGHTQAVVGLYADCDGDAVLARVVQQGAACHEGSTTCWDEGTSVAGWLGALERLVEARKKTPGDGYTDQLIAQPELAASKIEEEAAETAAVLRGQDNEDSLEHEAGDLLYHLVVALRAAGTDMAKVMRELHARR